MNAEEYQKNSYGTVVDFDTIKKDKDNYAAVFAGDNKALEKCLKKLWQYSIETIACHGTNDGRQHYISIALDSLQNSSILMHEIKNQLGVQNVEMQGRFPKQNLSNFFKLLQTHMELDSNYYRKNSDATSVLSIYCTKRDKEKFFDKLTALIENHIQIYERDLVFESGNAIKQTNIPQTKSQVFDKRDITTIIEKSKEISHEEQTKQTPVINNDMTK